MHIVRHDNIVTLFIGTFKIERNVRKEGKNKLDVLNSSSSYMVRRTFSDMGISNVTYIWFHKPHSEKEMCPNQLFPMHIFLYSYILIRIFRF